MKPLAEVLLGAAVSAVVFGLLALAIFLTGGCSGAAFEEIVIVEDAGPDDDPATPGYDGPFVLPAPHQLDTDAGNDALPDLPAVPHADADVESGTDASTDACDCRCLATTVGSAYCDGGIWTHCQDTPGGPVVTCVAP